MWKVRISGLCAFIGVWAAGVAIAQVPPAAMPAPAQPPGGIWMDDAWIATRIKAALVPLARQDRARVDVAVHAGRVTLSGRVSDRVAHAQVLALAQVRGVQEVDASALQAGDTPVH